MSTIVSSRLGHQHAEASLLKQLGFLQKDSFTTPSHSPSHSSQTHSPPVSPNCYPESHPVSRSKSSIELENLQRQAHTRISAGELTTFLSQIKYLNDEVDNSCELAPMALPAGASYADQSLLIKTHAAKVRNQLELKFMSISFEVRQRPSKVPSSGTNGSSNNVSSMAALNMGSTSDAPGNSSLNNLISSYHDHVAAYNPLQIIRDRRKRPNGQKYHRISMWQVTVSEQIDDIVWRHRTSKARAHKLRRKQNRFNSNDKGVYALPEQLSGMGVMTPSPSHEGGVSKSDVNCEQQPEPGPLPGGSVPAPALPIEQQVPFVGVPRRGSRISFQSRTQSKSRSRQSSRCQSFDNILGLPRSDCSELIARLQLAHADESSAVDDDKVSYGSARQNSCSTDSGACSAIASDAEDSDANERRTSRAKFCRNTASVTDTWNRLYRQRTGSAGASSGTMSGSGSAGSVTAQDGLYLQPLTQVTSHESTSSVQSRGTDVDDWNPTALGKSFTSYTSTSSVALPELLPAPPLLTVTTDRGHQILVDENNATNSSSVGGINSLVAGTTGMANVVRPVRLSHLRKRSDVSFKANLPNELVDSTAREKDADPGQIRQFGSLRPAGWENRKDPWEQTMIALEMELKFLVLFYEIVLNRERSRDMLSQAMFRMQVCSETGDTMALCERLKGEDVPQFMRYLSNVETSTVQHQQLLDAEIASCLDGLRVTTDLMVSEVNTTLNRRIRSVTSRMEKQYNCRECSMVLNLSYSLIEYFVLFAMWGIWCGVKVWKQLFFVVSLLRFFCNGIVVA